MRLRLLPCPAGLPPLMVFHRHGPRYESLSQARRPIDFSQEICIPSVFTVNGFVWVYVIRIPINDCLVSTGGHSFEDEQGWGCKGVVNVCAGSRALTRLHGKPQRARAACGACRVLARAVLF